MNAINRLTRVNPSLLLVLVLAVLLSACANKKREYKPNSERYYVNSVSVFATEPAGDEFAKHLDFSLKKSIGSPSQNYAREVRVMVQLLPGGFGDQSLKSLGRQITSLGAASATASIRVMDYQSGQTLEHKVITASSTSDDTQNAYISVSEDMVAQVRALLGLHLVPPHRVVNFSGSDAYSSSNQSGLVATGPNQEEIILPSASQMRADPLLNGQITPQTSVTDLMKKTEEVDKEMTSDAMKMKKTVAAVEKEAMEAPKMEKMVVEAPVMDDKKEEVMVAQEADDSDDDEGELCIVTVENDCLAPIPGS